MRPSRSLLILAILLIFDNERVDAGVNGTVWKGFSIVCNDEGNREVGNFSMSCHGIKLVRKIVQKFLEEVKKRNSLEILDGVSLVKKDDGGASYRSARVLKEFGHMDTVMRFLKGRELRIKLPSFLPANIQTAIQESLPQGRGHGGGGLGGGGKKGDNGVMMMALMMGKMMAAMGFGALALLAMKALTVSALALMLSLIVAAKKLAGGKEEDSHHIVYAQEVPSHHRRRRNIVESLEDLKYHPYRGHAPVPTEEQKSR